LIGHRLFPTVGVVKTSIARGIRIYDHKQVYRKATQAQGIIRRQSVFQKREQFTDRREALQIRTLNAFIDMIYRVSGDVDIPAQIPSRFHTL